MRASEILNEMVVRHRSDDPQHVIAFRDSIWLLGPEDDDLAQALADVSRRTGRDIETLDELGDLEDRPDILLATPTRNGGLWIGGHSEIGYNPRSSMMIKKVTQALGIEEVDVSRVNSEGDDDEERTRRWEMLGNIPDVALHGTSTRWLNQIIRFGLRPDTEAGNWDSVAKFKDRVFLALSPAKAMFHANHAVAQGGRFGSYPIVLKMRIPDKRLIDLDYDVALQYLGADDKSVHHTYTQAASKRHYVDSSHEDIQKHNPGVDWSRETGVFAYKGRIPANHIVGLIVATTAEEPLTPDNSVEISLADFREHFDDFMEWGFYDPIAFEEMRYNEDDDE